MQNSPKNRERNCKHFRENHVPRLKAKMNTRAQAVMVLSQPQIPLVKICEIRTFLR